MGKRGGGVAIASHPPCLLTRGWVCAQNDASIGTFFAFFPLFHVFHDKQRATRPPPACWYPPAQDPARRKTVCTDRAARRGRPPAARPRAPPRPAATHRRPHPAPPPPPADPARRPPPVLLAGVARASSKRHASKPSGTGLAFPVPRRATCVSRQAPCQQPKARVGRPSSGALAGSRFPCRGTAARGRLPRPYARGP